MGAIRLEKLPSRTPVRLTLTIQPSLHRALIEYTELYRRTYGEEESVGDLVPHMLEAFLASDRVFQRYRTSTVKTDST